MERSGLNQARGAGKKQSHPRILQFDWYIGQTPVKTTQVAIEDLSQFTKIVAQHLTNMPSVHNDAVQSKLSLVIISTEQADFIWAIKSINKIKALKKYMLKRGISMKNTFLILHTTQSNHVIPLLETETDGSIPHPAHN